MIHLEGLRINNPQAVLAAYGLLRVLSRHGVPATLSWRADDAQALLEGLDWSTLVAALATVLETRAQAEELNWADTIKGFSRERYRELMGTANPEEQAWLEAFWYEERQRSGSRLDTALIPTKLDMTAGGLKLFTAVKQVLAAIQRMGLEHCLTRALLEPWENTDDCPNLGWDPGAVKDGTSITGGRAPSAAPNRAVAAAVWLAFEALPLFPARWLAGDPDHFRWALPHDPATLASVQLRLSTLKSVNLDELAAQGWSVWESVIGSNGKFGYLLPGARMWSGGEKRGGSRRRKAAVFQGDEIASGGISA